MSQINLGDWPNDHHIVSGVFTLSRPAGPARFSFLICQFQKFWIFFICADPAGSGLSPGQDTAPSFFFFFERVNTDK
jgi:hypothetical protein